MSDTYVEVKQRLNGKQILNPLWPIRPNALYLFTFHSKSFSLGIYWVPQLFNGAVKNVPIIPDPDPLFSALEKLHKSFSDDALNYFGCVDYSICGVVLKRRDNRPDIVEYNWPSSWLSDIHVFRKLYYSFCSSFNSQNLIFK